MGSSETPKSSPMRMGSEEMSRLHATDGIFEKIPLDRGAKEDRNGIGHEVGGINYERSRNMPRDPTEYALTCTSTGSK